MRLEQMQDSPQLELFDVSKKELLSQQKNKAGRPRLKKIEDILPPNQVSLDDVVEESRIIEGVHEVGGAMFDEMYSTLFKSKKVQQILKDIVLARLIYPSSKHRSQQQLEKLFGKTHSLDAIYRMMDEVFPQINKIKQLTFNKTKSLFPKKIDLLFLMLPRFILNLLMYMNCEILATAKIIDLIPRKSY